MITSEPSVIINDIRDTIYHGFTTDPSLGIIYVNQTGVSRVHVHISGELTSEMTASPDGSKDYVTMLTSVVRNGLPNDSSCAIRTRQTRISRSQPSFDIYLEFKTVLAQEDYLQVFAFVEGMPDSLSIEIKDCDFEVDLVKANY